MRLAKTLLLFLVVVGCTTSSQPKEEYSEPKLERIWPELTSEPVEKPLAYHPFKTVIGHREGNDWVSYSGDGQRILSASSDGKIYVWNETGKRALRKYMAHESAIVDSAFPEDKDTILTADESGYIKLWRISTGETIAAMSAGHSSVLDMDVSSDGRFLVTGSEDGIIRLWAMQDFGFVGHVDLTSGAVNAVSYSPDGRHIAAVGATGRVSYLDSVTLDVVFSKRGHESPGIGVVFENDGMSFNSISKDGLVRNWDVRTQKATQNRLGYELFSCENIAGRTGSILAVTRKYGHVIITTDDWEIDSKIGYCQSLAFSPLNNDYLVLPDHGPAIIWKKVFGKHAPYVPTFRIFNAMQGELNAVAFNPDGQTFATGGDDGTVKIWDVETNSLVHEIEASKLPVIALAYDPVRAELAISGWGYGTVEGQWYETPWTDILIYSFKRNRLVRRFKASTDAIYSLAYRPDGKKLCAVGHDFISEFDSQKTGFIENEIDRRRRRELNSKYRKRGLYTISPMKWWDVAYSSDSKLRAVVAGPANFLISKYGVDGELTDKEKGARRQNNARNDFFSVDFEPDTSSYALGGGGPDDKQFVPKDFGWWDYTPKTVGDTYSIEYSPDGVWLASAGKEFVDLRSTSSNVTIHIDNAHHCIVYDLAFSPDGSRLVSVGKNGKVVVRRIDELLGE